MAGTVRSSRRISTAWSSGTFWPKARKMRLARTPALVWSPEYPRGSKSTNQSFPEASVARIPPSAPGKTRRTANGNRGAPSTDWRASISSGEISREPSPGVNQLEAGTSSSALTSPARGIFQVSLKPTGG